MILLKATQEKVLSVLQSVAGIVERRHTLPILASVMTRTPTFYEPNSRVSAVVLCAPRKRVHTKPYMCEGMDSSQIETRKIGRCFKRGWENCWRLVCDGGIRRRSLNSW